MQANPAQLEVRSISSLVLVGWQLRIMADVPAPNLQFAAAAKAKNKDLAAANEINPTEGQPTRYTGNIN